LRDGFDGATIGSYRGYDAKCQIDSDRELRYICKFMRKIFIFSIALRLSGRTTHGPNWVPAETPTDRRVKPGSKPRTPWGSGVSNTGPHFIE
jgi:hypothetical protein